MLQNLDEAAKVLRRCFGKGGDLTIVVDPQTAEGPKEFNVWSCLLSEWSDVFRAMLNPEHGFQEQRLSRIEIQEFSAAAVECFLKFLYSGVLEAQAEILIEVGLLADKYQVEELQRVVCKHLDLQITAKDACRLCEFADRRGAASAKQIAVDQILREPEEALVFAPLLGPSLLDEILDSGALCLEPGELMPIVLNWGLGESTLDLRSILQKSYIQREIAAMEDPAFMRLQPLATEVNCWSILQACRQKCKRGEHTTDALYSLWERYEATFDGELRPPFLGYWVNVIPGSPCFGMSPGPTAALLRLESLGRNDEASLSLFENDWLEWMLPNFQLHLEGVSFGATTRIDSALRVEMFVSMSGTNWDRTLDSQVWTEKHGPISDGQVIPCRTNGPARWFRLCMRRGSLEKAEFCLQGILQSIGKPNPELQRGSVPG